MSLFNDPTPVPRIACKQQAAAEALGITAKTLAIWEREGKITSSRPGGNAKLYLIADLERLARTGTASVEEGR